MKIFHFITGFCILYPLLDLVWSSHHFEPLTIAEIHAGRKITLSAHQRQLHVVPINPLMSGSLKIVGNPLEMLSLMCSHEANAEMGI